MRRTRWGTSVAIATVSLVVMAACGSDKKTTSTTAAPATTAAAAATTTAPASGTSSEGTSAATSGTAATTTAGVATTAAASVPATDAAGSYGLFDGVYKGAGGFTIDPKKECPADWNPAQGITATDIDLFISLATAGPLAGFGLIAEGMKSYFKYVNDNGGIGGRKINLDVKDDGYQPAQTKTNVDEALGSNKYAAFDAMLGTPNGLATWDTYNDECMPGLYTASGAAQWGDVQNHPWTVGLGLNYFTEAGLWEQWLAKEHPDLKTVAEVTYNNDFGQTYHQGFAHAIEGTDIKVIDQEIHEATAPNLTNQFTTMAASGAQVLLIETTGAFCTQAMGEVEKQTTWHPLVIMSATCLSLNQFF
ncbi:MAG: ABC transporter substrate-binding protein, partial [Ilumatobacteraceae bacterium]